MTDPLKSKRQRNAPRPLLLTGVFSFCIHQSALTAQQGRVPTAPRGHESQTFFGTRVPDPYRWLEQYEKPEVRAWYAAEDSITRNYMGKTPFYARFIARNAEMRMSTPYRLNLTENTPGGMVYLKTMPHEQSPSLYIRDIHNGERLLMSPAQTGTPDAVLITFVITPTRTHVETGYVTGGSEDMKTALVEIATGRIITNEIPERAVMMEWQPDGRSFFYTKSRHLGPSGSWGQKLRGMPLLQHVLGSDHSTDRVVFDAVQLMGDSAAHVGSLNLRGNIASVVMIREGFYDNPETFAARCIPLSMDVSGSVIPPDWSKAQVVLQDITLDFEFAQEQPGFARDGVYWINTTRGESHLMRFSW